MYQQVSAAPTLICICIIRYPHPSPLFVRVSADIRSPDTHLYLYQQVFAFLTLICTCISRYPQPRHSFVSISSGIRIPHHYLYVYQQVCAAFTLICISISRYPHPLLLFVRVSTGIRGLHTHLYLYQQVSAASTYSTPEVRTLSKQQRQCLFEDEQILNTGNDSSSGYSYSNCLVQCRLQHMDELCQCAPYFYPTGEWHFCDVTAL